VQSADFLFDQFVGQFDLARIPKPGACLAERVRHVFIAAGVDDRVLDTKVHVATHRGTVFGDVLHNGLSASGQIVMDAERLPELGVG